jgi:Protein of unknown function (DUF3592)
VTKRRFRRLRFLWVGVALLLLAALMAVASVPTLPKWRDFIQLQEQGETVTATVTGSEVDLSGKYRSDIIYYAYLPAGSQHPYSSSIRLERRGSQAEIMRELLHRSLTGRYLPSKPATHCLEVRLSDQVSEHRFNSIFYAIATIALLMLGIGLVAFGFPWGIFRAPAKRH